MNDLANLDFCVSEIDRTLIPQSKDGKYRAIVQKNFLWKPGSTIKIVFLNEPPSKPFYDIFGKDEDYFYQIPFDTLLEKEKDTPDGSKMDPLELKFVKLKDRPGGLKKQVPLAIMEIIKERFEPFLDLKFQFISVKNKDIADISIEFRIKQGCSSKIGTQSARTKVGEPSMILSWFSVQTVMHEFGHALGMLHEHQNPRGSSIPWNREKVIKWAQETQGWDLKKIERNILNFNSLEDTNGTDFDPLSIMKYAYPAEMTLNNKAVTRCLRLSINDVKFLASIYPPSKRQLIDGINQISEYILKNFNGKFPDKSLSFPLKGDAKLNPNIFFKWIYPEYIPPTSPPSTYIPTYIPSYIENYKPQNNELKFSNVPQNKFMSKYTGLC